MKKLKLSFLLILVSISSYSQNLNYGIEIFGGLSSLHAVSLNEGSELKYKPSYGATILFDYYFSSNLGIQAGLGYMALGSKFHHVDEDIFEYEKVTTNSIASFGYLNIPLNIRLRNIGSNDRVAISTGIYVAPILSGKQSSDTEWVYLIGDIRYSNQESDLIDSFDSKVDFGLNLNISYSILKSSNFRLDLGAFSKLGLNKTIEQGDNKNKNYCFGLNLIAMKI